MTPASYAPRCSGIAIQGLTSRRANGIKVLVRGRISLYEARGDFQFIAENMQEAGIGELQRAFEALRRKLHSEGLFDAAKKRDIPPLPDHLAIITSATGAAIHDVMSVLGVGFLPCGQR